MPFAMTQRRMIFGISMILFAIFSNALPGFLPVGNLLSLLQSAAIVDVLGTGMAIIVISREINKHLSKVLFREFWMSTKLFPFLR